MADTDDSDIDVCTVDEETTSSYVGLTVVAAETYIGQEKTDKKDLLVPLTDDDLLTKEKAQELSQKRQKRSKTTTFKLNQSIVLKPKIKNTLVISNKSELVKELSEDTPHEDSDSNKNKLLSDLKEESTSSVNDTNYNINRNSVSQNTQHAKIINKNDQIGLDEDIENEDDYKSEEEMMDTGVNNVLKKFCFESDHLAIKNNRDYQKLLQTLAVLEAQRIQAIKDFEELNRLKEVALADPLEFVKKIQDKSGSEIPKRQQAAKLPGINWVHYMTAYTQDKYVPQITTRSSIKEFEQEVLENVNDIDEVEDSLKESSEKAMKLADKHSTFKQKWSVEEQEKLEQLLKLYPPEEVEARRWEKIAKALGNRTPQQVSSRIQKYFIKLARAKLPIPGRLPSTTIIGVRKRANPLSYKNSTFFPSWRPIVSMKDEDENGGGIDSAGQNSMAEYMDISDEEQIPDELKNTPEYSELMELKRIKKQHTSSKEKMSKRSVVHKGFMCDGCGMDPISGVRWHCMECPVNNSVDFCNNCFHKTLDHSSHTADHKLLPIHESVDQSGDDDYTTFEQRKFKYNYLDPNFVPT